ncbi:MAG TPA: LuxR C-terminal-related transcriptional regulator [Streptosporangiaceae bacterium]|nr:LuxR C-terminal-related transcriptional regulator [Streptosporangiaceae bacterium]
MGASYAAGMSQREAEVLQALGAHLSNAQIAGRLHISVRTVESHVSSLLRKFGVTDRRELAELAQTVLAPAAGRPAAPVGLPALWTSFVGRDRERDAILTALKSSRLVSLVGPGGVGKTRLAVEVAREAAPSFPSGCAFVDLVPVAEGFVTQAVAALLGVTEEPGQLLDKAVLDHLAEGRWLLVLDNCEHLLAVVAAFAERLLATCPGVTVLATSRERLAAGGERALPVHPLSLPDGDDAAGSDATSLFAERAQAVAPDFAADQAAVGELCARLDGMPLAIELAAARSASLGLAGLRSGLDDRLRLLAGGRGSDARHHSLRAVIGWSHDMLDDDERAVFRRLSVFVGGFDLDAASAIASEGPPGALADLVGRLADKSLLASAEGGRWRMLETVRAYALEQLAASGEEAATRERHLRWAAGTADRLEDKAEAGQDWRAGFDQVADDLRAALSAATGAGPDGLGHQLARSLGHLAYARRFLAEAIGHYEAAAARAPDPGQSAADLQAAAHVALAAGRGTAFGLLLEAADRASAAGDGATRAAALARAVIAADRFAASFPDEVPHDRLCGLLEEAVRAAPQGEPTVAALLAAATAWNATGEKGSPDPALAAEALAGARRTGDPVLISGALAAAVAAAREAGQLRESYRLIQERALLLDRLPRHDPRAGAEIVDIIHESADSAAIAGDLPAALASARRGQGDSIVVGRHELTLGIEVVPLVLQGKFDEALSHAAGMWDEWQREGRPASRWVAPASYAAVLAHGLRGDEEGSQLWRARISELISGTDPAANRSLAGFAAFVDARIALHQGHLEQAAGAAADLGIGSGSWFGARHLQYDSFALAIAVEAAVIQRAPDAAERLAHAAPAAAENRWAAACLARAAGRHTGEIARLEEAVAAWEHLEARFERAITLLLIPGREREGLAELAALGCPPPA